MASGTASEALRDRVSRLENFVGVPEDDGAVPLSVSTEQHAIELVDLRRILDDFMTESSARITNIMEDVIDQSKKEGKKKTGMLSALQVKTGLRKGEETYLATLVEIKPDTTDGSS
ncbi:hypothetical protein F0562_015346 [Nyssa sinensis]|uniref:Uncharacterized protein n=1 Tax=Nyssa sinensis TaxID=561372 RepID=A0A5J4ZH11_9ASTE|nr:hypothetical protein F0562_015346 [Nyssa sinensis]